MNRFLIVVMSLLALDACAGSSGGGKLSRVSNRLHSLYRSWKGRKSRISEVSPGIHERLCEALPMLPTVLIPIIEGYYGTKSWVPEVSPGKKNSDIHERLCGALPMLPIVLIPIIEDYYGTKTWVPVSTDKNKNGVAYTCLKHSGNYCFAGDAMGDTMIYDTRCNKLVGKKNKPMIVKASEDEGSIVTMACSTRVNRLFTNNLDSRDITVCEGEQYLYQGTLAHNLGPVSALLLFDDKTLVVGDCLGNVAVWDIRQNPLGFKVENVISLLSEKIQSLAKIGDQGFMALVDDGSICLFAGLLDKSFSRKIINDGPSRYNHIVLLDKNRFAATFKNCFQVFDIRKKIEECETVLPGHQAPISAIAMVGNDVLTGSEDGSISIWYPNEKVSEMLTGKETCDPGLRACVQCGSAMCTSAPKIMGPIIELAAHPDGQSFVAASKKGLTHWKYGERLCKK